MKLTLFVALIFCTTAASAYGLKGCIERVLFYYIYVLEFQYAPKVPVDRIFAVDLDCGGKPCSFEEFLKLIVGNPGESPTLPKIPTFDHPDQLPDREKTPQEMVSAKYSKKDKKGYGDSLRLKENKNSLFVNVQEAVDGSDGAAQVWKQVKKRMKILLTLEEVKKSPLLVDITYLSKRVLYFREVGDLTGVKNALEKLMKQSSDFKLTKLEFHTLTDGLGFEHEKVLDFQRTLQNAPDDFTRQKIKQIRFEKTSEEIIKDKKNPQGTTEKHISIRVALEKLVKLLSGVEGC